MAHNLARLVSDEPSEARIYFRENKNNKVGRAFKGELQNLVLHAPFDPHYLVQPALIPTALHVRA